MSVQVTFLGSGDAFSAGGKHQAGYLLQAEDSSTLLDCGVTTLKSLKTHNIDADIVDRVLISHLHGDHFGGLPFLFLEYLYEKHRQRPLEIVGPPGTEARVWDLFRAMYKETSAKPLTFEPRFVELQPSQTAEFGPLRVEPFRVPHQEREISLGYRVHLHGRSVLYSGDTGWSEELIRYSENTDLFICECCYFETRLPIHLDYPRLAQEQHRFQSRRLILTHLGREVLSKPDQVELELAHDGLVVSL